MNQAVFQKLKDKLSKFCYISAEHCFLVFLVLTLITLLIGGLLFYQYSILIQRAEPEITKKPVQFKESLYQKVLQHWQVRAGEFEAVDEKEYLDIFK